MADWLWAGMRAIIGRTCTVWVIWSSTRSMFYDSAGAEEGGKDIPLAFLKKFHLHVILHERV